MRAIFQLLLALVAWILAVPAVGGSAASSSVVEPWNGGLPSHESVDADRSTFGDFSVAEREPESEEEDDDELSSEFACGAGTRCDTVRTAHDAAARRSRARAYRRRARAPPSS